MQADERFLPHHSLAHSSACPCSSRPRPSSRSAQDNPSLTAFVDGPNIVQTCGCGGNWGPSQSPPMSPSSAATIVSR